MGFLTLAAFSVMIFGSLLNPFVHTCQLTQLTTTTTTTTGTCTVTLNSLPQSAISGSLTCNGQTCVMSSGDSIVISQTACLVNTGTPVDIPFFVTSTQGTNQQLVDNGNDISLTCTNGNLASTAGFATTQTAITSIGCRIPCMVNIPQADQNNGPNGLFDNTAVPTCSQDLCTAPDFPATFTIDQGEVCTMEFWTLWQGDNCIYLDTNETPDTPDQILDDTAAGIAEFTCVNGVVRGTLIPVATGSITLPLEGITRLACGNCQVPPP